jgi:hypothetical protein
LQLVCASFNFNPRAPADADAHIDSGDVSMAGNHGSGSGDADWSEHVKTYNGFIWLLKYSAGFSALTLIALYLICAR